MEYEEVSDGGSLESSNKCNGMEDSSSNSPGSAKSFAETQLEIFHHQHGLLILHLMAALMFVPSLAAWWQRVGTGQSFPWFADSVLCIGVILHGVVNLNPESNTYMFSLPGLKTILQVRMQHLYQLGGYYSFLAGLAMTPYKVFYAIATIGVLSSVLSLLQRRSRVSRRHSHRH